MTVLKEIASYEVKLNVKNDILYPILLWQIKSLASFINYNEIKNNFLYHLPELIVLMHIIKSMIGIVLNPLHLFEISFFFLFLFGLYYMLLIIRNNIQKSLNIEEVVMHPEEYEDDTIESDCETEEEIFTNDEYDGDTILDGASTEDENKELNNSIIVSNLSSVLNSKKMKTRIVLLDNVRVNIKVARSHIQNVNENNYYLVRLILDEINGKLIFKVYERNVNDDFVTVNHD